MRKDKDRKLEYEYRYIDFDRPSVLGHLQNLDVTSHVRYLLNNYLLAHPDKPGVKIRIREMYPVTEKTKVIKTLTIKRRRSGSEFEEEYEVEISDAGGTFEILSLLGCELEKKMQKFRDVYVVANMGEVVFDAHPGLPPDVLEVECKSKPVLRTLIRRLGLAPPEEAKMQPSPSTLYHRYYGIPEAQKYEGQYFTFDHPSNVRSQITKNKAQFDKIIAGQRKEAKSAMRRTTPKNNNGHAHVV